MDQLVKFRKEKDEFFGSSEDPPITSEQREKFKGLQYYPENPKFHVKAFLEKSESQEIVDIKTSAGDTETYKRYGEIKFQIDGNNYNLAVFQSLDRSHLFLSFRDKTNSSETYHDGRYIEVEEDQGKVDLDFNYAYNPYCAYNNHFRCPITPDENTLNVAVTAGEKRYY